MQNFFEQVREGFKHTLPTLSRYAGLFHWHMYCEDGKGQSNPP